MAVPQSKTRGYWIARLRAGDDTHLKHLFMDGVLNAGGAKRLAPLEMSCAGRTQPDRCWV